jgi:glycosyltransferase involved in cell wall biosynthesis
LLNLQDKKVIVYTGTLSKVHGSLTLMKTLKILKQYDSNIELVIAGGGQLLSKIKKYAKKEKLENVKFLGVIKFNKVPTLLKTADVLVIPHVKSLKTDIDAPTKLFEYLASGKPIVAFNLKAIAEIVDENAVLVEPENPDALAMGILKVLQDKKLAKKLGASGKKIVEKYSWNESARLAYGTYKTVSN